MAASVQPASAGEALVSPEVAAAIDEHTRAVDAFIAALPGADAGPDDEGTDKLVTDTCGTAHASFQRLLSVPCQSMQDVQAKARALLTVTPLGGYSFEHEETVALVRSLLGEA